ncbi:hypothetical protein BDY21DRAFT_376581 [Lineolata rhizophorae]|uniref:Uncharacterized protein n=1 Tax=Lineolata rhizophorae TaxID=578093 RepID=A0A6A6PCP5_9PEZI|nr:hypothetical protein BDY21DRAFT_376581 [Lineolata rhizophorae]
MPRPPIPKKKKAGKPQTSAPETENDFLEAADAEELGGGKWRAGDATKALRFFRRAIDIYDAGLRKFPQSLDLAYNKARLQYELSQDPRLSPLLGDPVSLLRETLQSHRRAMNIDQTDSNLLFNTAQVLSSLAEAITDATGKEAGKVDAVPLLQESIELLSSCLTRQELEFSESQAAASAAAAEAAAASATPESAQGGAAPPPSGAPAAALEPSGDAEWAAVITPVTATTLLDTATATLSALGQLAVAAAPSTDGTLATVAGIARPLIRDKIPAYISRHTAAAAAAAAAPSSRDEPDARLAPLEARLAVAAYRAAFADAEFRSGVVGADEYVAGVRGAFGEAGRGGDDDDAAAAASAWNEGAVLTAEADALMEAVATLDEAGEGAAAAAGARRDALLGAAEVLRRALRRSAWLEKAKVGVMAGDAAMLLGRCGQDGSEDMLREAEALYGDSAREVEGAVANLKTTRDAGAEVLEEATVKWAVAGVIRDGMMATKGGTVDENRQVSRRQMVGKHRDEVGERVRDMVEDGLIEEGHFGLVMKELVHLV